MLLTQLKVASRAKLEHAAGNIGTLLPVIWSKLRDKDRWQTGPIAAAGIRAALMKVRGLDYVPETLRTETFRSAARAVLNAHFPSDIHILEKTADENEQLSRWIQMVADFDPVPLAKDLHFPQLSHSQS